MRTMNRESRIAKSTAIVCVAVFILFTAAGVLYPSVQDESMMRMSQNGSHIFAAGYLNVVKERSERIIEENSKGKGMVDGLVSFVQSLVSQKVIEETVDKVVPELQKKTSSANPAAQVVQTPVMDAETADKILKEAKDKNATVTNLSTGGMLAIWQSGGCNYFDVYDVYGAKTVSQQQFTSDSGLNLTGVTGVTDLGDGRFAVILDGYRSGVWINDWTQQYSQEQSLQIYNVNGALEMQTGLIYRYTNYYYKYENGIKVYNYCSESSESNYYSNLVSLGNGILAMSRRYQKFDGNSYSTESYLQTIDAGGSCKQYLVSSHGYIARGTSLSSYNNITGIMAIGNGKFILRTDNSEGTHLSVLDSSSINLDSANRVDFSKRISQIASLGNGQFAVAYNNGYDYAVKVYNSNFGQLMSSDVTGVPRNTDGSISLNSMVALDNGTIIMGMSGYLTNQDGSRQGVAYLKMIDTSGSVKTLEESEGSEILGMYNNFVGITSLGGNNFAVTYNEWKGYGETGTYMDTMKQFSIIGASVSERMFTISENINLSKSENYLNNQQIASILDMAKKFNESTLAVPVDLKNMSSQEKFLFAIGVMLGERVQAMEKGELATMLRNLIDRKTGERLRDADSLQSIDPITLLLNIIQSPTNEQKKIIDAISALLDTIQEVSKLVSDPKELKEAADELVKAAAVAVVVQAIPDLIKEGDMAQVRDLFSRLDAANGDIIKTYRDATKSYYDELKKTIAENIDILQMKNILSKKVTEKELEELPRSEIEKIMEKIRREELKTMGEETILRKEADLRAKYIDPSNKLLEANVKSMLKTFTKEIKTVLNTENLR